MRCLAALSLPLVLAACASSASSPQPAPPTPATSNPVTSTPGADARQQLSELEVAPGNDAGYDREEFPHWSTHADNCNTRELVLRRAGKDVDVGRDCSPRSGTWTSPYDGATWHRASDVDIDHMVPLAEAWRSGANEWTRDQREQFANDLTRPQLWAVTDNVNQAKSDKDPASWQPPRQGFRCTYARAWIEVKHHYRLTVNDTEKQALTAMLERC